MSDSNSEGMERRKRSRFSLVGYDASSLSDDEGNPTRSRPKKHRGQDACFEVLPGFTDLSMNKELCHVDRPRDSQCPIDRVLGGLCNAVLEQKELLKDCLQSIIDWVFNNPFDFSAERLFDRFTLLFGSGSQISRNFVQILQVICRKRADTTESRRERILGELPNKNVRAALHRILPNAGKLRPLVQSLGGTQMWLNTPMYLKEGGSTTRKYTTKKEVPWPTLNSHAAPPTNRCFQSLREGFNQQNNNRSKGGFKKDFKSRANDSFHRKQGK